MTDLRLTELASRCDTTGQCLRTIRECCGITMLDLAKVCMLSVGVVSDVERNRNTRDRKRVLQGLAMVLSLRERSSA